MRIEPSHGYSNINASYSRRLRVTRVMAESDDMAYTPSHAQDEQRAYEQWMRFAANDNRFHAAAPVQSLEDLHSPHLEMSSLDLAVLLEGREQGSFAIPVTRRTSSVEIQAPVAALPAASLNSVYDLVAGSDGIYRATV